MYNYCKYIFSYNLILKCTYTKYASTFYHTTNNKFNSFKTINKTKMAPKLKFSGSLSHTDPVSCPVVIIGQLNDLHNINYEDISCKLLPKVSLDDWTTGVSYLSPSPTSTWPLYQGFASVMALPLACTRHNTPSRCHAITKVIKECKVTEDVQHIVMVCSKENALASACAVGRAFPLYSQKSSVGSRNVEVTVEFLITEGDKLSQEDIKVISDTVDGVQLAARIVDTPANEMHTDAFVEEICAVAIKLGIEPLVIRGKELQEKGFGGIYGVGKAAVNPPALVVLSHTPEGAVENIAWVGKGIVYDTGGLSIKSKTGMPGMKRDCGGAAAVLGAFYATVKSGFNQNLHALFCLAENAVGPAATKPDDIHVMYSGRTVEINNTDAEGRLVLSDGVAYAYNNLQCNVILDIATLTGAQAVATGKYHGGLLTNEAYWEDLTVKCGRVSGDLVHPLVYTPELHFSEFDSSVADMKNSVADRSNATSSCAGLFIASHLGFNYKGAWIHVDMAAPSHVGERATGYGVSLLTVLFAHKSCSAFLKSISPAAP